MTAPRRAIVAVLLFLASTTVFAATTTERLATLGRVWGVVRFTHPYTGSSDVQLDAATIRAIEQTLETDNLLDATQTLLASVGDRATYVRRACMAGEPSAIREPFLTPAGALFVPSGATVDAAAVQNVSHVIFDLRPRAGTCASPNPVDAVATHLIRGSITAPQRRKLLHRGYRSQDPEVSNNFVYSSSLITTIGAPYNGTATSARTTTFIVDEYSTMSDVAAAMVFADQASIVSVGPYRDPAMAFRSVTLGDGWEARIRAEEAVQAVTPRVVLGADANESAIIAAAESATPRARRRSARGAAPTAVEYEWRFDDPYAAMKYPDAPYRILGAYRYWNAIQYFYPYKHLIDPWEPRLEPMIDTLMGARSQSEYELAIAELTTWVPDGHSLAFTTAFLDLEGRVAPGFHTSWIEGKVIVRAFTHDSARNAGIALGDELLAIDGRPIADRIAELRRYLSASTEHTRMSVAAYHAPRGATASALMRFRRPDGTEYEAAVPRSTAYRVLPVPSAFWQVLEGNIGYVDVNYLRDQDHAAMKRDLLNTRAIIFDMRGYPRSDFFALASWVSSKPGAVTAQLRVPHMLAGEVTLDYRQQTLPPQAGPYRGKVFLLIDERAQSAAEHFGLWLEAATNLTIVGSPTSGANGNVTDVAMPGGIFVWFTGMDVRHADGRQLQRVGLEPHVLVRPTIAGVAASRDEVLEAALALARE